MKIYTRTGDQGTTALFGGNRVAKSHPRIEAYGTVDEANAHLGLIRAHLRQDERLTRADTVLEAIQPDLFVLGADLATPFDVKHEVPRIEPHHIEALEQSIDAFEADLPKLKHFILPGGSVAASHLHIARTVCRRAERLTVEAATLNPINEDGIRYLNRLSDLLFVLSRWVNLQQGIEPPEWVPKPR